MERWKQELKWLEGLPADSEQAIALRKRIEKYEDQGHGACYLRDERIARLVQDALLHFDGKRYRLLAWCIMPNHVHVMMQLLPGHQLSDILHSWKSFTAHKANKLLDRSGDFWMPEYFDRFIRDERHLLATFQYIHENPVKAGLVANPEDWPWSSAGYAGVSGSAGSAGVSPTTVSPTTVSPAQDLRDARLAFLCGRDDRVPSLVVDTRHFPEDFKWRLLAHFDDLDEALDGLLIKSENWQALNLLLEKYREKVKCIYIDPPYNTGSDGFIYKDRYQHSSWLSMMADRFYLARTMLGDGATLAVQVSDIEDAKLKEVLAVTFGADEFVNRITVRTRAPSGFKTVNVGVFESAEYLYLYAKEKKKLRYRPQFVDTDYDENYSWYINNPMDPPEQWRIVKLKEVVAKELGYTSVREATKRMGRDAFRQAIARFALEHADRVFRYTEIDDVGASKKTVELKQLSRKQPDKIFIQQREGLRDRLIQNGREISLYVNKLREFEGTKAPAVPLTNIWTDVPWEGIANEGFTRLEKGKKPERLIHRVIDMASNAREFVMDYFLGSGTTCAVSQKAQRRWIGIDFDDFLIQESVIRLKRVLSGEQTGVSKIVGWRGGGFFKYQYLEQYEDTLNNLELPREQDGQLAFERFGDEYLLRYMLEFETQGSPSLLNLDRFKDPFAYKLKVQEGDEIVERPVDLVETFNYLLGLQVRKMRAFEDNGRLYRAVLGEKNGKRVAIVWRSVVGLEDNEEALMDDKAFIEGTVLPALLGEAKPDRLLVNGACFVKDAEAIEPEFHRLMFAPVGV